jgi:NLI interacting factor-like phosphatase
MNVILDIDETFVQYVAAGDWASLPDTEKAKYKISGNPAKGVFILRPHFNEFFDYLFTNCKTVNLWTWSDDEYAESVARVIREQNPKWKVSNVWFDKHVDASIDIDGFNKDLNYIWYEEGKFQPCNTVLIDDLPANTNNPANKRNGIQLKAFNVLGEKLSKEERKANPGKIRTGHYTDLSKDDTLLKVIEVLKGIEEPCKRPFKEHTKVGGGRRKTYRRILRATRRKLRR